MRNPSKADLPFSSKTVDAYQLINTLPAFFSLSSLLAGFAENLIPDRNREASPAHMASQLSKILYKSFSFFK